MLIHRQQESCDPTHHFFPSTPQQCKRIRSWRKAGSVRCTGQEDKSSSSRFTDETEAETAFYRAPGNWMKFRSREECFSAHHGRTITQLCPQEECMTPLYLFAICLIDGRLHPAYSLQNFLASVLKFPLRFQFDVWRSRLPLVLFITATGLQKAGWQRTASSVSQWTVQAHMARELQPNKH